MIREYVIVLSEKQYKSLIERSDEANFTCELAYLQLQLNNWLENESDEGIGKALAKAMDEKARLEHTKK
jgi:hypothetical protein